MTAKQTFALIAGLVVVLTAPSVMLWRSNRTLDRENGALRAATVRLVSAAPVAEPAPQSGPNGAVQMQRDAAELARLRAEVSALRAQARRQGKDASGAESAAPPSNPNPMGRMEHGRQLRRDGKYNEALQEYLWCFDEGAKDGAFSGVRVSFLLDEIASLATDLPAARQALVTRRDVIESAVLNGTASGSAALDLARLNSSLGEGNRTLALFDQLPADSADRGTLVRAAMSDFLAAQRYREIVEVTDPVGSFFQRMSLTVGMDAATAGRANESRLRQLQLQNMLNVGADALEALAGAGQSERAKNLADKVLTISSTPETLQQLVSRAERSGNHEVTEFLQAKAGRP